MKAISERNTNESLSALEQLSKQEQPSENKANSKRAYWLEKTRKALGTKQSGEEYTFGQLCGVTSKWSVRKIKQRYHECRKADIPFAPLWWWKNNNQ